MPPSAPVIIVPAITATYLRDEYPLPPEAIWNVLRKDYERASLHPDNLRWEAREPARVAPDQLFEIAYAQLVEELRYNLKDREDEPVPVFLFGYDWRQPLNRTEAQLASFIDEVIERTKLLAHYNRAKYGENPTVNLVGHSMGGLIIAGYLAQQGATSRVSKVATIATPFQGSFEAVIKITTGTANLGTSAPSSREREAARITPALYHLLPSFQNGLNADPGLPTSLFDPGIWQQSVLQTLEEYIRLHGLERLNKTERRQAAQDLLALLLAGGAEHRRRIDDFRLESARLAHEDWLCLVGVDATTRVRLRVVQTSRGPDFAFDGADRKNQWITGQSVADRRNTGDETVPFEGAIPRFLDEANLVCLRPDDFGYWEIGDSSLSAVAGFHSLLPTMNLVHRLIVRHFTGRPDNHGNTWGRAAPGVAHWRPPLKMRERPPS